MRVEPMPTLAVKRLSGVKKSGSERFELGSPNRGGASVKTLDCVGIVRSVTSSSGRARGRTAAEVIAMRDSRIIMVAIFGKFFEVAQLCPIFCEKQVAPFADTPLKFKPA